MNQSKLKICSTCGELKQQQSFNKDKTHKDGFGSMCAVCKKESISKRRKLKYIENKESISIERKIYYESNKQDILQNRKQQYIDNRAVKLEYGTQYYKNNKAKK